MKLTKNKNIVAFILGIIFILCISIVGILAFRTADLSVSAETNAEYSLNASTTQFDIIDYQGNKVNATYEFIKLNATDCSVRITNKSEATTALIPSIGTIDGVDYSVTEIASNGFMSSPNLKVVRLSNTIKRLGIWLLRIVVSSNMLICLMRKSWVIVYFIDVHNWK